MTASGQMIHLRLQPQEGGPVVEAIVSRQAAALRALRVGGVDIVEPTTTTIDPPGMAGAILAPWPNRVAGATWEYQGSPQRLDVTEPDLGNANHGLLADTMYDVVERDDTSVTLSAPVSDRAGYPFALTTQVRYALSPDGITVDHLIRNDGDTAAPVAVGAHPYLRVGGTHVDDLTVTIDAASAIILDDDTHLPVATVPVDGLTADLRAGRRVADAIRHVGYTNLTACPDGRVRHTLTRADGATTTVWADSNFAWVQVWITDQPPGGSLAGRGLLSGPFGSPALAIAIEPMTAPPDALNSGTGLRWLPPGTQWNLTWGISLDIQVAGHLW
ncbi:MAG: aldose 1-epimerase family protein [Cellulomonadaceae bacterium]|jgi:aldose 1-epimerase|nr:aldose 1-epimerase family protein [Cellulomonadaceae bacterium]